MERKKKKSSRSLIIGIVLAVVWKIGCVLTVFILFMNTVDLKKMKSEEHKSEKTETTYVTSVNGYDMSDLSLYGAVRVYDLLDANGFTEYEGSGYGRMYHYDAEDFQNLKGLDESFLYGFYCVTSRQNFDDVLSVLGYDSLDGYLIEKGYVDRHGSPSIDAWNDATMYYMAELLKQEKQEWEGEERPDITEEYNGYGAGDLNIYQYQRVYDLLERNGFEDYTGQGYDRFYHYDYIELQEMEGLDETYVYGLYYAVSEQNFQDMISLLGYHSLEEYLTAKGYVNEKGEPDIYVWRRAALEEASVMMAEDASRDGQI